MFLPFFTHALVFILIVFIVEIEQAYTDDATENNEKGRVTEFKKMINRALPTKSLQIPCQILTVPMDRVKSALKDLELMNELYCNPNTPPVETSRVDMQDETQTNPDPEVTAQYNPGHNPNSEQDPLGQRTINYPVHYGQPWLNYPNIYPLYADRAGFQNPNYYYPARSPYIQLYSGFPSTQPAVPIIEANPDHHIMSQGTPVDMSSSPDDNDNENINLLKKKARKYDRHCSKKRMSRRLESPKIDESDYINGLNETDLDIANSTELKSN